jgi:diacylglycerol kinase (ATP)
MNFVTKEVKRLANATRFSMQGLRAAWHGEAAFRFEVVLAVILIPTALVLDVSHVERIILIATIVLVLIVELLNSAVEAVVDRVSDELHPLSGRAKDLGSAAVFVSLFLTIYTWAMIVGHSVLAKHWL